jgi:hypothetical protein
MNKQPANTFGSTTKTDVTGVNYSLTKQDLFIYNLTFVFSVGYTYNKPMETAATETTTEQQSEGVTGEPGEPTASAESIWSYDVSLTHDRALSRKLHRSLGYTYHFEKSSLNPENLTEHDVTLDFTYTF